MREYLLFLRHLHPWIMQVTVFGTGACVGSFLNVCILRIPLGRSIVFPGSHCSCGKPIAWYDNIPILSWFILRGRARCCGAKFSIRYPMVELFTALAFLWLWTALPMAQALAGMIFFFLLLLGAMIDLDHMILPDFSTLGGMIVGLALSLLWPQIHGLPMVSWNWPDARQSALMAVGGAVAGAGFVYWIGELGAFFFRRPAMGYGDMLLMGCVGAFCGWRGTLISTFGGAVLACAVIIPMSLFVKREPETTAENAVTDEKNEPGEEELCPLGRRHFALDYQLVLAAGLGGLGWLLVSHSSALLGPGIVYLGVLLLLALVKNKKLSLHEPWLLIAVVGAIIISAVYPRMQGITPTGWWIADASSGATMGMTGATIGAGLALWVLEFANLIRLRIFPVAEDESPEADYNQIWGEGYLLVFAAMGAFCGWRTTVPAIALFATVGALKGVWLYFSTRSANKTAAPEVAEKIPEGNDVSAGAAASTWRFGMEIPFGPWLCLAAFLYYTWPTLHLAADQYLNYLKSMLLGEVS